MSERETWATRVGFILAAVGSAVGLGNIWQFPFRTAQNGGAAFVLVYLAAVFIIGFPAMLGEFVVGRGAKRNPIDAFSELGHRQWAVVGALGSFTGFWILSFYSVVGGWVMRYLAGSFTGAYFGGPEAYFGSIAAGPEAVAAHGLFMLLTVAVVAFGINDGIETATKVMVPSIVILLLGLAAWATTLDGVGEAYAYYLSPDLSTLAANIGTVAPDAVGQAFFTLSLGMGAMITYSSYLGEDDSLPADGSLIVVLNTFVGVLAGFVVFPILFAQNIDPATSSTSAVFVALAGAFSKLPFGKVLGVVFFLVLLLAALSSAISLLEVMVSYVVDHYGYDRKVVALAMGGAIFTLGIPTALDTSTLTLYNDIAYAVFLPLAVLGVLVFVGFVDTDLSLSELRKGSSADSTFPLVWLWLVRTVSLVGVIVTLILGVKGLLGL